MGGGADREDGVLGAEPASRPRFSARHAETRQGRALERSSRGARREPAESVHPTVKRP